MDRRKWYRPIHITVLQALAAGGGLVSYWDFGRSSLGVYLAICAYALFEAAKQLWRITAIWDRRARK